MHSKPLRSHTDTHTPARLRPCTQSPWSSPEGCPGPGRAGAWGKKSKSRPRGENRPGSCQGGGGGGRRWIENWPGSSWGGGQEGRGGAGQARPRVRVWSMEYGAAHTPVAACSSHTHLTLHPTSCPSAAPPPPPPHTHLLQGCLRIMVPPPTHAPATGVLAYHVGERLRDAVKQHLARALVLPLLDAAAVHLTGYLGGGGTGGGQGGGMPVGQKVTDANLNFRFINFTTPSFAEKNH